ncbi:MAG: discoidin domain-containing protein [Verrucomicrobiales bacterium]|jgi:hypothetical protein|nr:discoidin domain-containing protein [Verrucomicrobiales bacterium]
MKKTVCISLALTLTVTVALAADLVPLKTELPKPVLIGTPVPVKVANLEPARKGERPPFMLPRDAVNLAQGKAVTSSDSEPLLGELVMITDGVKDGDEGNFVELGDGKQWVQLDLGQTSIINAVLVWHFHSQARVYHDVVVQVSDDPDFISGVTTVFNSTPGAGKDFSYLETYEGKLIDAKGAKSRYVRLFSKGNTTNAANHYIEVEVWGVPAK